MALKRRSGVLLHISSLPSSFGIGDFGDEAFRFIDQLKESGFSVWQILPLGPNGPGNSPYQAYSAYAGDPLYISIKTLFDWGLTTSEQQQQFNNKKVDFEKVTTVKMQLLKSAWKVFDKKADTNFHNEFRTFINEHDWWLADYALYSACKEYFDNKPWNQWTKELADRKPSEIENYMQLLRDEIRFIKFVQFMFFRQWFKLKTYANSKGIQILGDIPLYVSHNSADVWANQSIFLLNKDGQPSLLGGVPPDYFNEDGQLWGNPVYDWNQLSKTDYNWWIARLHFNFHLYDMARIDHFRGLESFWAIPANSTTAKNGEWLPAKGYELLNKIKQQINHLPVIAEDLGTISPEVTQLRTAFNLPGMKVLQFAFGSDSSNEHLPHNFEGRNVVYTGTHDNDTLIGWWKNLKNQEKSKVKKYNLPSRKTITQQLIEMVWSSTAQLAIIPMQDILELGNQSRMNLPGTASGNWSWRYQKNQLKKHHLIKMKTLNNLYNRCNE
jgi:4-alpha-glucanotransferase